MDPLYTSLLANLGGWLLVVAGVVLAIRKGDWVPRFIVDKWLGVLEDRLKDKDEQIAEYRAAFRASDARGDLMAHNITQLLDLARTTNESIEAISRFVRERGGDRT